MATEVTQYFLNKFTTQYLLSEFSTLLQEVENDYGRLSVLPLFRSIKSKLDGITFTSNKNAHQIHGTLKEVIFHLNNCRSSAHKWRKVSSNKCLLYLMRALPGREIIVDTKKQLEDIEKKVDAIIEQADWSPPNLVRQTYPIIDTTRIIGFDSVAKKIEELLMEQGGKDGDGFATIGIVGGCGCGKTALAQKVLALQRVKENFSPTIWVCLSDILSDERADMRARVLKYILEELGHDISELEYGDASITTLLEKLQRQLMGKRYLIVLDDAWRFNEWYSDLGYRFPSGYAIENQFSHGLPKGSGGGIIVTSRREDAAKEMVGAKNLIHVEPLSDNICWEIFTDVVGHDGKIDLNDRILMEKKDDIISKCDGLPLAACTLGKIIPLQIVRSKAKDRDIIIPEDRDIIIT